MKELLQQLAAYNLWANQRLTSTILNLPEGKSTESVKSSFSSLHLTLLHMWDAESIWWQRTKLQENVVGAGIGFNGSTSEVIDNLLTLDTNWKNWVDQASNAALEHVFQYYNSKRELFKQPVYQMLLHLFNHNTYHRGQLVTILQQLGVSVIPGTDYIIYSRTKK